MKVSLPSRKFTRVLNIFARRCIFVLLVVCSMVFVSVIHLHKLNVETRSTRVKKAARQTDRAINMKGTVKDLLKISGVHGYVIARDNALQMKLPSKHRFAGAKRQIKKLYDDLVQSRKRPGNTIEIYFEDLVLTVFLSGVTMLMVLSSTRVNLALVRMTGKLVIANLAKEKF
jgi:hypothetical protein